MFRKGQTVIPISIKYTLEYFGTNEYMVKWVKEKKKIKIDSITPGYCIKAGGWTWDERDLRPAPIKKQKQKPKLFSPEMLME